MVDHPEEILAPTFTKKAAGEMQNRITGALVKAGSGVEPVEPHEAKTIARQRGPEKDPAGWGPLKPRASQGADDRSLSAGLVRQMPLISRLGKQPAISEA
jgi:hypothetical protein